MLYEKLIQHVPQECTEYHDILNTYSTHQDGYAALFSMMRHACGYLKLIPQTWGPRWTTDLNSFAYHTQLISFIDQQRHSSRQYSQYEIAAEILQQAATHDSYRLIAMNYITRLQMLDSTAALPFELQPHELINIIETNKTNSNNNPIIINKFNHAGPSSDRDRTDT